MRPHQDGKDPSSIKLIWSLVDGAEESYNKKYIVSMEINPLERMMMLLSKKDFDYNEKFDRHFL